MTHIAMQRLHNQQLEQSNLSTPGQVVAWLGAVQAQEYGLAKWALGLRMPQTTDAAIEQAFTEGTILRTHIMRPTWHFVTPADIRWLMALTAPRVQALNATYYRKLELDDALLARSQVVIAAALQGGQQLTRAELGVVLAQAGIVAEGVRLAYIVSEAELTGLICSGARRGKQFTYALLDERTAPARTWARDEALAELTKRYFVSHGPAQVKDFAWWSGLTVADGKAGLDMVKSGIVAEVIKGKTYYRALSMPAAATPALKVHLLPVYDEYTVAYKDHSPILEAAATEVAKHPFFISTILVNGRVAGMWRRHFRQGAVVIEATPYRPFTDEENEAFAAAAHRYGEFLGLPVVLA